MSGKTRGLRRPGAINVPSRFRLRRSPHWGHAPTERPWTPRRAFSPLDTHYAILLMRLLSSRLRMRVKGTNSCCSLLRELWFGSPAVASRRASLFFPPWQQEAATTCGGRRDLQRTSSFPRPEGVERAIGKPSPASAEASPPHTNAQQKRKSRPSEGVERAIGKPSPRLRRGGDPLRWPTGMTIYVRFCSFDISCVSVKNQLLSSVCKEIRCSCPPAP